MVIGLLAVLCGCAGSNQVVQKGVFQHRKYNHPGWFLDIPKQEGRSTGQVQDRAMMRPPVDEERSRAMVAEVPIVPLEAPVATIAAPQPPVAEQLMSPAELTNSDPGTDQASLRAMPITLEDVAKRTDRIFPAGSLLALSRVLPQPASTDDVGGIDIFALLGFIFAFIFPIAGLVLSIIGLNRTRGGGRGHGLALAGLILSIVFIVVYGAVFLH